MYANDVNIQLFTSNSTKYFESHQQIKMSLPLHKRYEIVFLHSKEPKLGYGAVAKIVDCSKSVARYWLERWTETKDLSDKSRAGPKRVTTEKEDKMIISIASRDENLNSNEINKRMKRKGVEISDRTVRRRLHESAGRWTHPTSKPLLTEKHRKNQLNWAQKMKDIDWNQVLFTDESTFKLNQYRRRVWRFPWKKKIVRTVKHPVKVHVWGSFSSK